MFNIPGLSNGKVRRNNETKEIAVDDIVIDDIVLLESGDKIPSEQEV